MLFVLAGALLLARCSAGFVIQSPEYRRDVLATNSSSTALTVPEQVPSGASPIISSNFLGFAFEETSFPQYAGAPGSPNTFSVNLLNSITSRSNSQPSMRIGGTSLDNAKYVPTQQEAISFPPNQTGNVPAGVTIGPAYFGSFANFPNVRYHFCIMLATNNLSNSVEFASAGYPVIKDQLEYLEIGNEPQAYPGSVRPSTYSPSDYIAQWLNYSTAINSALGLSSSTPIYQAIALGSPGLYETSDKAAVPGPWYPNALFELGFAPHSSMFGAVSMHWYQTLANYSIPATTQLQQELLNHSIMTTKMTFYQSAISYFAQNYPNIRINLDEAASSLNGATNRYGLETTFGAALWQVDWMLWCMFIVSLFALTLGLGEHTKFDAIQGINRIGWQQISASAFDLWQPSTYKNRTPAVLPAYYAMLFAADFIGTTGDTQVTNIDLNSDVFTAYGAYSSSSSWSGTRLSRIAIINLSYWVGPPSATNVRPSQTFALQLPSGVAAVQVKYLNSIYGTTASLGSQITWEGYSWTYQSNGNPQFIMDNTVTLPVIGGVAYITVKSSEAVMVFPDYLV